MNKKLVEMFMDNYKYCPMCDSKLENYKIIDNKLVIKCSYRNKKGAHWDTELTEEEVRQAMRKI